VCDLETSRMGAPYIYDISRLRVKYQVYRNIANTHCWFATTVSQLKICNFFRRRF